MNGVLKRNITCNGGWGQLVEGGGGVELSVHTFSSYHPAMNPMEEEAKTIKHVCEVY